MKKTIIHDLWTRHDLMRPKPDDAFRVYLPLDVFSSTRDKDHENIIIGLGSSTLGITRTSAKYTRLNYSLRCLV